MNPLKHEEDRLRATTRHGILTALLCIAEYLTESDAVGSSISELALEAGFSENHLSKSLRSLFGESLGKIARRMRLEKAARLLLQGCSLREAANMSGYWNASSFSRSFSEVFGVAPSQWAKVGLAQTISPDRPNWIIFENQRCGVKVEYREIGFLIERREAMTAAVLPYCGYYANARQVFAEVERLVDVAELEAKGWLPTCLYYDDGIDSPDISRLRAEVGFMCSDTYSPPPPMFTVTIPAGVYLSTIDCTCASTHNRVWKTVNEFLVPKTPQVKNIPGMDIYNHWPLPWENMNAHIVMGLNMDMQPLRVV